MKRRMMHSKIHRATITDCNIDYEGSITLDSELIQASGMLPFEQVQVVDVNNGARFDTYIIEGAAGTGEVTINGAAARLVNRGDKIIIIAYGDVDESEARALRPRVVLVDESNLPVTSAVPKG